MMLFVAVREAKCDILYSYMAISGGYRGNEVREPL